MSSIFQHCYDIMKSSNDQRQATVKKYDERVQLVRMDNHDGNTHFYYVIYNYDCKLYVITHINCKSNDAGEVQWSIVMEPHYTHVSEHESILDMWDNIYLPDVYYESLEEHYKHELLSRPTSVIINRDDYANNPLMLEQQLRQVVKRTYGNRWYDESVSASIKKYNEIASQYSLIESRARSSYDNYGFYHQSRVAHLIYLLGVDTGRGARQHELYLQEMEQEDINTSIRMLF